ncbi:MAG: DUF3786 domain-containing protein [Deltaproteobacteria bacterium]|nr:DUF3786 domain-containing protein [Deltaproteobacteria bacterium]
MKNSSLSVPEYKNYEYGYNLAYKLAGEQLAATGDLKQQCRKSGAEYKRVDSKEIITVEFLNQAYQVTLPDIDVSLVGGGAEVPLSDKILILHYLTLASGASLSHKMIAFQELPEGASYLRTFSKRSIEPLVKHFGGEPERLVEVAKRLGGRKADYGDAAVTINGFKLVPVTLVLWRGDEEFPPRGNILFDSTIPEYLSTYDITMLCDAITWRLVRFSKEGGA